MSIQTPRERNNILLFLIKKRNQLKISVEMIAGNFGLQKAAKRKMTNRTLFKNLVLMR